MDTFRLSLVSTFALVLSSLSLGGCAADSEPVAEGEDVGVTSQALTVTQPTKTIDTSNLLVVMPECRAVLASTGPAAGSYPNEWGCPAANPYVGQRRFSGSLEGGVTVLRDQIQLGTFRCTTKPFGGGTTCTRSPDRLIEQLCEETRTYDCPCGVETVMLEGEQVASCKRVR